MSEIAQRAGIGRATLCKYFPDVDAILLAWHERQVGAHLEELVRARDSAAGPDRQVRAVLTAYALIRHTRHGGAEAACLHRGEHVDRAEQHLANFLAGLLQDGASIGVFRSDVSPTELAAYCLHALGAAGMMQSRAAVQRLVQVTMAGLRPPLATAGEHEAAAGP